MTELNKTELNKKAFEKMNFDNKPLKKGEFVVVYDEEVKLRTFNQEEAACFVIDVIKDDCYVHIEGYPETIEIM